MKKNHKNINNSLYWLIFCKYLYAPSEAGILHQGEVSQLSLKQLVQIWFEHALQHDVQITEVLESQIITTKEKEKSQ